MTPPASEDVVGVLAEVHTEFPGIRVGLLLQAAADRATQTPNVDLHGLTAAQLCSALVEYREVLRGQAQGVR